MATGCIVFITWYPDDWCFSHRANNAKIMKLPFSVRCYCNNFSLDAAFRCLASAAGTVESFDKVDTGQSWLYCMLSIIRWSNVRCTNVTKKNIFP